MALRRITPHKKPLLHARPFSSSSSSSSVPPFPPPPPSPSNDRNDPHSPSSHGPNPGERPNAASSLFQDIRERLRSSPAAPPPRRIPNAPHRPGGPNTQQPAPSFEGIRRQLESYRASRSDGGTPPLPSAGSTPSFQDLLRNNSPPPSPQGPNPGTKQVFGFDSIRDSIRNIGSSQQRRRPGQAQPFLSSVPSKVFGKELGERSRKAEGAVAGKEEDSGIALLRDYSYEELGKKLEKLRPAAVGKDGKEWFSLEELQGRIAKLAELDKEEDKRFGGQYAAFRNSLTEINNKQKAEEERKKKTMQGASFLASIVGQATPEYMHHPPQEELLERYFHPDHMSSEEKMKLELQKVRDEFKMSENDCGSARVQIAQLTLKIKHLSSVLHKKDKHSRKGLQEMVQRRKKYLKYLRRTDWDSYCLVLSKLGLRDVPEYKAPDYKSKSINKPKPKKTKSKSKSRGKKKLKI